MNANVIAKKILIFVAVFLLTLETLFPVFPAAPIVFFFICIPFYKTRISTRTFFTVLTIVLFYILVAFHALAMGTLLDGSVFPRYIIFFSTILVTLGLILLLEKIENVRFLIKSVESVLFVVCLFWVCQVLVYYSSGVYLDAYVIFTGEESRYNPAVHNALPFRVIRATSFFAEPSNYFAFTFPLLCLSIMYRGRAHVAHYLVITTYFLTFSSASAAISVLLVLYLSLDLIKKNKAILILFAPLILYVIYLVIMFNEARFIGKSSGSLGLIISNVLFVLERDPLYQLLGFGFGFSHCGDCVLTDTGFYFYFFYMFGLLSLPAMFMLMRFLYFNIAALVFIALYFLSKSHFSYGLFWFFIVGMHYVLKYKGYGSKKECVE